MIRLLELFAGTGAIRKALIRQGIPHEVVGISEWNVNSIISYDAIHTDDGIDYTTGLTKKEIIADLSKFTFSTNGKDPCNITKIKEVTLRRLYNAHKRSKNLGSILDIEHAPDNDFTVWGFPCQDISIAGDQKGIGFECNLCSASYELKNVSELGTTCWCGGEIKPTRSGLYYEGLRILADKRPAFSLIENVKNLTSKKFRPQFEQMLKDLEAIGYNNYYPDLNKAHVLNAKDYGVPQNRERVFIVSIRKDIDPFESVGFPWPKPYDNGVRLKDLLEANVDERYYIDEEKAAKLISQIKDKDCVLLDMSQYGREGAPREYTETAPTLNGRDYKEPRLVKVCNTNPSGRGMNGSVYAGDMSPTITTNKGECLKILVKANTKRGYDIAQPGDSINLEQPNSKTRRGRVGVANTLTTSCNQAVVEPTGIDMSYNNPKLRDYANCISARHDRGISNRRSEGTGVIVPNETVCLNSKDQDGIQPSLNDRVYDTDGVAPAVTTSQFFMGNVIDPMTCAMRGRYDENGGIYQNLEIGGDIANAITSVQKDSLLIEPNECIMLGHIDVNGHDYQKRVYSADGVSPTIPTGTGGGHEPKTMVDFRIRKLTELECWRLMDYDDEDFYKAAEHVSNSQLYMQAGNGIVVRVLEHIAYILFKYGGDYKTLGNKEGGQDGQV